MKALVCGGRDYVNGTHVSSVLDKFIPDIVVSGGQRGADDLAIAWAKRNGKIAYTHYADWDNKGLAAGPIRNQQMLDMEKPDLMIAFPGGKGTSDMIKKANKAGVCVWVSIDVEKETWDFETPLSLGGSDETDHKQ